MSNIDFYLVMVRKRNSLFSLNIIKAISDIVNCLFCNPYFFMPLYFSKVLQLEFQMNDFVSSLTLTSKIQFILIEEYD